MGYLSQQATAKLIDFRLELHYAWLLSEVGLVLNSRRRVNVVSWIAKTRWDISLSQETFIVRLAPCLDCVKLSIIGLVSKFGGPFFFFFCFF